MRNSHSPDESTVATFNIRSHYGSPDEANDSKAKSNERTNQELVEICQHNKDRICFKCLNKKTNVRTGHGSASSESCQRLSMASKTLCKKIQVDELSKTDQFNLKSILKLKIQKSSHTSKTTKISKGSQSASCKKTLSLSKLKLSSSNSKKYSGGRFCKSG